MKKMRCHYTDHELAPFVSAMKNSSSLEHLTSQPCYFSLYSRLCSSSLDFSCKVTKSDTPLSAQIPAAFAFAL